MKTVNLSDLGDFSSSNQKPWTGDSHHREMSLDSISVKVTVDGESVEVTMPADQFVRCVGSVMFQTPAYVLSRMLRVAMDEAGVPANPTKPAEFLYVKVGDKFGVRPEKSSWRETVSETDDGYMEMDSKEFARLALSRGVKPGKSYG